MLEIGFTVDDLARTRLAMSPLSEVVASVRVLKNPRPPVIHRRWHGMVRPRLAAPGPGVPLLFDLVQTSSWYQPDFLSPAPRSPVPDLTAELAGLRAAAPAQIRADLDVLGHALTHPAGSLEEVTRPRRRVGTKPDQIRSDEAPSFGHPFELGPPHVGAEREGMQQHNRPAAAGIEVAPRSSASGDARLADHEMLIVSASRVERTERTGERKASPQR